MSRVENIIKKELDERNISVREDVIFRLGRKNYNLNLLVEDKQVGFMSLIWKRTLPTNKIIQLEQVLEILDLKKLILICSSISENAKDFLAYRNIPIEVVYEQEILDKKKSVDTFLIVN